MRLSQGINAITYTEIVHILKSKRDAAHVSESDRRTHHTCVCFDESGKGTSVLIPVAKEGPDEDNTSKEARGVQLRKT